VLDVAPRLKEWAARMAAIGHHNVEKSSAEEALEAARASTAASTEGAPFIDYHGVALGDRVAVMPSDYGMDPVEGELVLSADNEFAVQRTDPMAGTVIVHFPRVGFQLKKA
jgi:hypothetical protein